MTPTLSVIIPVYKVENYLERCVQSVLEQDYKDFEIILVDDGSPDKCPQLCDEFAVRDSRIKVLHKKNGGLSSARNAGIRIATGKYIAFLDSDDQWIKGKLNEVMSAVMENGAEMTIFDSINIYPDGHMMKRDGKGFYDNCPKILDITDYYATVIKIGDFKEAAYTKIFPRDFIINNDLFYYEGIYGEDSEWMFRLLRVVKRVQILDTELYLFTSQREGSIQNSIKTKNVLDIVFTIERVEKYTEEQGISEFTKYELEQCAYLLGNAIGQLHYIKDKKEKRNLRQKLASKVYLFKYATKGKTKKIKTVYNLFGFNFLASVLELYLVLHKKNLINKKKTYHG